MTHPRTGPAVGTPGASTMTRVFTWLGVISAALAWTFTLTRSTPIWVPLILAALGLTSALLARRSGLRQTEPFDGRLSLLGAMACLPLLGYLVIVLPAAFATS